MLLTCPGPSLYWEGNLSPRIGDFSQGHSAGGLCRTGIRTYISCLCSVNLPVLAFPLYFLSVFPWLCGVMEQMPCISDTNWSWHLLNPDSVPGTGLSAIHHYLLADKRWMSFSLPGKQLWYLKIPPVILNPQEFFSYIPPSPAGLTDPV